MGVTAHGLIYPDAGADMDGDEQIRDLAESAEAALAALVTDTGFISGAPLTAATGWRLESSAYRKIGKVVQLQLFLSRTGADITGSGVGNIPDTDVCTITDTSLRPQFTVYGWYRASRTGGSCQLDTAGVFTLTDAHQNSVIEKETDSLQSNLSAYFKYPVP